MAPRSGEAIMKVVWNFPLVTLYERFSGDVDPLADDVILTDFCCPSMDEVPWSTMPGPGFIFGCDSQTMDECLGQGVLGLPDE
eukprot:3412705-Ditylum_brightwellii.AAC.1